MKPSKLDMLHRQKALHQKNQESAGVKGCFAREGALSLFWPIFGSRLCKTRNTGLWIPSMVHCPADFRYRKTTLLKSTQSLCFTCSVLLFGCLASRYSVQVLETVCRAFAAVLLSRARAQSTPQEQVPLVG